MSRYKRKADCTPEEWAAYRAKYKAATDGSRAVNQPWTTAGINRAAALWGEGRTTHEIAELLGRSVYSIKSMIVKHREKFPRVHANRLQHAANVKFPMTLTRFQNQWLAKTAKAEGKTKSAILRELILARIASAK